MSKLKLIPEMRTSLRIAELTGKRHDNVKRVVADLVEGGIITFTQPEETSFRGVDGRKQTASIYNLDERSSVIVVARLSPEFTAAIVDEFRALKIENAQLRDHIATREATKLDYPPMSAAVLATRTLAGKETAFYHYSLEADMINRIVLGCTSKQYIAEHGTENVRDSLSPLELKAIEALQRANTTFIDFGLPYDERKAKLQAFFMQRHNPALVAATALEHA